MGDIQLPREAVIDHAELRRRGITRHRAARLVQQGLLHRVEPGVFTSGTPEGRLLLAALSARREHLVFTGLTAFQMHAGQEITVPVTGRVPYGRSAKGTPLLRLRQSRVLHHVEIDGVKVVPPVAAAAELPDHDENQLIRFLEHIYSGREGRPLLEEDLAKLGRIPGRVRELIRRAAIGADSESERRVFRALRKRGVEVLQNELIGPYFWDGVLPGPRIAIEIDSYRYHGIGPHGENHQAFVRDRWKANHAAREGYRVLRFTGECVHHHLNAVVEEIMAQVEGRPARDVPVWKWHSAFLFPEMMADGWDR